MFFRVAFILQKEYGIAFDNNFCKETLVFSVLLENFHKQKIYESNPNLVTWIFLFVNMKATGTSQKKKEVPTHFRDMATSHVREAHEMESLLVG